MKNVKSIDDMYDENGNVSLLLALSEAEITLTKDNFLGDAMNTNKSYSSYQASFMFPRMMGAAAEIAV